MGAFISLNLARRPENVEKIDRLFLCAPARDFMKNQIPMFGQIPGDTVPIPGILKFRQITDRFRQKNKLAR